MSEPNTESYSASKGGLLALTHALAISLAPTCASIASAPAGSKLRIIPRYGARITSSIPPAASAGPEDIAELVSWLLDGKRSGFVTGANFVIDGGMTRKMIYEEQPENPVR